MSATSRHSIVIGMRVISVILFLLAIQFFWEPVMHAQEATCEDAIKNGDETDLDCGGICPPCDVEKLCNTNDDCVDSITLNNQTYAVECADNVLGVALEPAGTKKCISQEAAGAYVTAIACSDGQQNGDETDIDCGGSCPQGCMPSMKCNEDSDCQNPVTQPINPLNPASEPKTYSGIQCLDTLVGQTLDYKQCTSQELLADFLTGVAAVQALADAMGSANAGWCKEYCSENSDCAEGLTCEAPTWGLPYQHCWDTEKCSGCMAVCSDDSNCKPGLECVAPTAGIPYRHCYASVECAALSRYPSSACNEAWHTGTRNDLGGCISRPVTKLNLSIKVGFQDDAGIKDTSYTDMNGGFHDDDIIFESCMEDWHLMQTGNFKCFRKKFTINGDVAQRGYRTFTFEANSSDTEWTLSDLIFPHDFQYFRIESNSSQDKWFLQGVELSVEFAPMEGKPDSVVYYRNPVVNRWIKKQDGKNWFSPHNVQNDQAFACFVFTADFDNAGTDGEVFLHFPIKKGEASTAFRKWLEIYDYEPPFSDHTGVRALSLNGLDQSHDDARLFLNWANVDDFDRNEGNSYGFTGYAVGNAFEPYYYISRGGSRNVNDDLMFYQLTCYTFKPGDRKFIENQEVRASKHCPEINVTWDLDDPTLSIAGRSDRTHLIDQTGVNCITSHVGAKDGYWLTNRSDINDNKVAELCQTHTWPTDFCTDGSGVGDCPWCFNKVPQLEQMIPFRDEDIVKVNGYESIDWQDCGPIGFGWFSFDRAGKCRF